jgi:hypothetical protein
MPHRCGNCGAWNTNDAQRCTKCNFPFDCFTWYREGGFIAGMKAGWIFGIVIAATVFPATIGAIVIISSGLALQWIALPVGVSILDAVILYRLRDRLMRVGGLGPYSKKDWWSSRR